MCLVAQSCLTLCSPTDCSLPGSSVHRISQTRILEQVVISYFGNVPNPGIGHMSLASPALTKSGFFITNATWEAWNAAKQSVIHRS